MNLKLIMVDVNTGEIFARTHKQYKCNFGTSLDAGFTFLMQWIQSAVRGVRTTEHKEIELRIYFGEDQPLPQLPFGMTEQQAKEQAQMYVR